MIGNRSQAVQLGLGLGFVGALVLIVSPMGVDDFSEVFWPAGRAADPYASGVYFYPVWNTWMLRALALFPRQFGLCFLWACSMVYVLTLAPVWDTPSWVALLAPPFLTAMFFGHPFEAMVFVGVSLLWLGWRWRQAGWMGMGIALCLFKPQLGLLPALVGAYTLAFCAGGRRWAGLAIPVGMVCLATLLEWVFYGVVWVSPWWEAMRQAPKVAAAWNVSALLTLRVFWFLWLPIGLWFLPKVQGFRRRLWVAMALGLLISPYWAGYSLYPLVAMAGCWTRRGETCFASCSWYGC